MSVKGTKYHELKLKRGPIPGSNCFESLYRLRDGKWKRTRDVCKGYVSAYGSHVNQLMRLKNAGFVRTRKVGEYKNSPRLWQITKRGIQYLEKFRSLHLARRISRNL